jgi:undecaprenyl pyrophosphate synthase
LERATCECNNLVLNICLDYGGREEIIRAIASGATTEEEISKILTFYAPDPDLILRTGG